MSRRQFECEEFRLHPDSWKQVAHCRKMNLVWRDQIYVPVRYLGRSGFQVITISKSVSDIWIGISQNASSPSFGSVRNSITSGETRPHSSAIKIDFSSITSFNSGYRVWGDDCFLLTKNGTELIVWEFDAMDPEPSDHPLRTIS
ncbi:hypothetical protein EPUL_006461, partial [Erysiphe pulchra]